MARQIARAARTIKAREVVRGLAAEKVRYDAIAEDDYERSRPKGEQPLTRFRLRLLSRRAKDPITTFAAQGLALTRNGYDVPIDAHNQATVTVIW